MSEREREEGFLARWARRKSEAAKGRPEEEPARDARPAQARMPEPEAQGTPEERDVPEEPAAGPADEEREPEDPQAELQRLGLPDPESLGPDASFRAFFAENVPGWVKRRAMRRLFRVNPIIRTVDMMDDYAEDFTDAATVTALAQSAGRAAEELRRRLQALAGEGDGGRERPDAHDASGSGQAGEGREGDGETAAATRPAAGEPGTGGRKDASDV